MTKTLIGTPDPPEPERPSGNVWIVYTKLSASPITMTLSSNTSTSSTNYTSVLRAS